MAHKNADPIIATEAMRNPRNPINAEAHDQSVAHAHLAAKAVPAVL